jgi:uncharacterized damage-inducible protein DinB
MKEAIILFAKYNQSVNEAMNSIIKTLGPEEWEKNLGGFFPSVRSQCSHLYICDFNWLRRFKNLRPFTALNDPFFDQAYSFKETLFADMNEYLAKRPDLDRRMLAFVNEVSAGDLGGTLKYTDSEGKTYERNFGGCLLQFLNHDTHHRGAISAYLDMLGKPNDFSSLARVL